MKTLLFIFLATTSITLAQDFGSPSFWIQPNINNPATSGVFNKMAFNASVSSQKYDVIIGRFNYNERFKRIHGGIGSSWTNLRNGRLNDPFWRQGFGRVNYAYHHYLKEGILAFGIGVGVDYAETKNFGGPTGFPDQQEVNFAADFGVLYHHKKFNIGASLISFNRIESDFYSNLTADYLFELNEKWSIKPTLITSISNSGFNEFRLATVITYNNMFWLSPGAARRDTYSIGAGYDHKQKIRVGVFFTTVRSQLNNGVANNQFQLNLSYRIPHLAD